MNYTEMLFAIQTMNGLETLGAVAFIALVIYGSYKWKTWVQSKKKLILQCEAPNCANLTKETGKIERIDYIKFKETIADSMCVIDILGIDINEDLADTFAALINGMSLTEEEVRIAKKYYNMMLKESFYELKDVYRKYVKRNHFVDMDDVAFQDHIKNRIEDSHKVIRRCFDASYNTSILKVGRDDLIKANMETLYRDLSPKLSRVWVEIRSISEKSVQKIKDIEEE